MAATLLAETDDMTNATVDDQLILVYRSSWTTQTSQRGRDS